ncbi:MAG: class I SAM-dependent methyltransferase [Agriterribacter sp.]
MDESAANEAFKHMDVKTAYNSWAEQYDSNRNRTRDMEALVLRKTLSPLAVRSCLEIGCGTGKNTVWLMEKCAVVTAVDLSEQMLEKAKQKIQSPQVSFVQADITGNWSFAQQLYQLITFSLVLEHIEHLEPIFKKAAAVLNAGGFVYVGELHPFKQYTGTKARFDTPEGRQVVSCFNHNLSDFYKAAKASGLQLVDMNEYFDEDDSNGVPRIISLLFQKSNSAA